MLQQISWGEYIRAAGILLVCYYTAVGLLFYRSEIRSFLSSLRNKSSATTNSETTTSQKSQEGNVAFDDLEETVNDIDSILEAGKEAGKDILLLQLKERLADCDGLRHPAYRAAVHNHIIRQAEQICGVRIEAQELEA